MIKIFAEVILKFYFKLVERQVGIEPISIQGLEGPVHTICFAALITKFNNYGLYCPHYFAIKKQYGTTHEIGRLSWR